MRLAITLDPDVAESLKLAVRDRNLPMKTVVNDLLRSELDAILGAETDPLQPGQPSSPPSRESA